METISLKNVNYHEEKITCIKVINDRTYDIEVEGLHYYILSNGIISHNTSVLVNNVSGGLEPIFSFKYKRTFIIPYPPEGLILPKNIDWNNKQIEENKIKTVDWKWSKEGDENILFTTYKGNDYKIDKNRGLTKQVDVIDYGVKHLINCGEWNESAPWASDIYSLNIDDHLNTMAVMSKYICSSMSKTINIPNDYLYEDFKNVYIKAYETGTIKGVTTYRAGTMASVLSSDKNINNDTERRNGHIIRRQAPVRPNPVPCDVHSLTVKGMKWTVFVGLVKNEKNELSPYEVFAFKKKFITLPNGISNGYLTKVKRGVYSFTTEDGLELENLPSLFDKDEQEALTRMISLGLRHGADIKFIVEQLNKAEGDIMVFSKAIARSLKKYISNNEKPSGDTDCPTCKEKDVLIYMEGCIKCSKCGWSQC